MQLDFHYYATYLAAYLAGWSHEESLAVCYSAQFVDCCSRTFLKAVKGPVAAATTQLQLEMMDAGTDLLSLQDITRIWASFHFLPKDLYAQPGRTTRLYRSKYRLICGPYSDLVRDTVLLAKGRSPQAAGIAMHVLADTWAHRGFAGTPSLVINNTDSYFYELTGEDGELKEKPIVFRHNPSAKDNPAQGIYVNTLPSPRESSVMNLGHGRAGHLPDYSFMRYKYLPAWGNYEELVKDNPAEYMKAFCQMVYALRFLKEEYETFSPDEFDSEKTDPYRDEIDRILRKRQTDASEDWKEFAQKITGREIPPFDLGLYRKAYTEAPQAEKDSTAPGRFFVAAMAQKSMVTRKIFRSGNLLAGVSIDFDKYGFSGIRDFYRLIEYIRNDSLPEEGQAADDKISEN